LFCALSSLLLLRLQLNGFAAAPFRSFMRACWKLCD